MLLICLPLKAVWRNKNKSCISYFINIRKNVPTKNNAEIDTCVFVYITYKIIWIESKLSVNTTGVVINISGILGNSDWSSPFETHISLMSQQLKLIL